VLTRLPAADGAGSGNVPRVKRGRILVVEDDEGTRRLLVKALSREGYDVNALASGEEVADLLQRSRPQLILLDVMLPGIDGLSLLQALRQQTQVPLILVTELDKESDRVRGLRLGADDYIVKPFSPRELVARVDAVLRRATFSPSQERLDFGDLVIDFGTRQVSVRGNPVALTAREYDLLAFLASSPGQVFTRGQILERVWRSHSSWQAESTVTEHVRRIRQKLEVDPQQPRWLKTIRGVGYSFHP
jgi:DNA-binding response OmpR family regulator